MNQLETVEDKLNFINKEVKKYNEANPNQRMYVFLTKDNIQLDYDNFKGKIFELKIPFNKITDDLNIENIIKDFKELKVK